MDERNQGFSLKPNIKSLSDLIFGLALSIGALTLLGQAAADFSQALFSLAIYGFSFLILVTVWRAYSSIMSVLSETPGLISANILLLFLVSIEPYLFNQLFTSSGSMSNDLSILYSIDLACIFLVLAVYNNYLSGKERKLIPQFFVWKVRLARNLELIAAAIITISVIPIFWSLVVIHFGTGKYSFSIPLRVVMWTVPLLLNWSRWWLEKMLRPNDC